jgi:hypothetical protein
LDEGDEIAAITKIEDQEAVQNGENGNGPGNGNGINDNPENATTD